MFWSKRPVVRALLFLITGIFIGYFLLPNPSFAFYFVIIAILVLAFTLSVIWVYSTENIKWQWAKGMVVGLMLVLTGVLLVSLRMDSPSEISIDETHVFLADVINEPYPTKKSVKMILKVRPATEDGNLDEAVKVIAFFEKNGKSKSLKYGDRLLLNVKVTHPHKPLNPGEFDYQNFLAINGIYYTVFVADNKWNFLSHTNPNILKKWAGQLRQYLLNSLNKNGLEGRSYAVAAAILLGYDNLMDTDLERDFVTAGAMHILCVSGLHVGVIYLVFNLLFGFFRKNRLQQIVKALLLLLLVWAYAMLTGLSPSVQRASVMISIFIIGDAFNRQRDAYNTLAVSAFLLLLFNPLLVFNVGFQLSYAAVLGILTFYRPIYLLFYFKNNVADKLWSVTVLSCAAQLGTFPLAAHYFHFFPTYFWLSNLLIFPLSFAIIVVGMAFISVSWLPLLPKIIGTVLSGLVYFLNQIVGFVKYLPFYGLNDLFVPWPKVLLIYLLIVLVFMMLIQKKARLLFPVLSTLLFLIVFEFAHQFNVMQQKKIVIYSINKHSAYDFINGDRHLLLLDTALQNDKRNMDYFLTNSRLSWGLKTNHAPLSRPNKENEVGLYFDGEFAAFGGYRIAVVDGSDKYFKCGKEKLTLDMVIVRGKRNLKLEKLREYFEVDNIILDASIPYWKQKNIEKEAKLLGLSTHNVREKGAFILELGDTAQQFEKNK